MDKKQMIKDETKRLYREKIKIAFDKVQKFSGSDVDANLAVLWSLTVLGDMLQLMSNNDEHHEAHDNLVALLGELSMSTQMQAIKNVDPAQYLKNCAVIGGAFHDNIVASQKDMPADIAEIVNKNFFDLI